MVTTYTDSVRFLYSLGNEIRTAKLGLGRISALAERLGHPECAFRAVHVAGTNGKGSVCAMVASALEAAGVRTGLYTSPHLVEPTERIQVDGRPVPEELFLDTFQRVHETAQAMVDREELSFHPTYFETVTLMAFLAFRELGVDTAVIEVGMGGRLDATNIVRPHLTAITPVDYDHERYLGHSLAAIAQEKAGILKPGVPVIFSRQRPEVSAVLRERALDLCVPVTSTMDWPVEELTLTAHGSSFRLDGTRVHCPLAGEHQVENALTATLMCRALGIPPGGISSARWPGRIEQVQERPDLILDGAHNPAGIRALTAYIRQFYDDRPVWIVYGAMRDKSLDEIAGLLSSVAERIILTTPGSERALRREVASQFFDHPGVEVARSAREALDRARAAPPQTAVFLTGSLLLVGEAKRLLGNKE